MTCPTIASEVESEPVVALVKQSGFATCEVRDPCSAWGKQEIQEISDMRTQSRIPDGTCRAAIMHKLRSASRVLWYSSTPCWREARHRTPNQLDGAPVMPGHVEMYGRLYHSLEDLSDFDLHGIDYWRQRKGHNRLTRSSTQLELLKSRTILTA
jgi:hypothetical protein